LARRILGALSCGESAKEDGDASPTPVDLSECTSRLLPFYLLDAAYSEALGRIVGVTGLYELVLLDPATLETVLIPSSGTNREVNRASLSLSPDGLSAAVMLGDILEVFDLAEERLTATIPTTTDSGDVVLAGNGFAYVFPRNGQWVDVHSVEIATGVDHGDDANHLTVPSTLAKLHPSGSWIYGIEGGQSSRSIALFDISGGIAQGPGHPQQTSVRRCGDIWISDAGTELYTGCATVFRANPGVGGDGLQLGEFEPLPGSQPVEADFQSMALARDRNRIYAAPGSQYLSEETEALEASFVKFDYDSRALLEVIPLPCAAADSRKITLEANHVFAPRGSSQIHVLAVGRELGFSALLTFEGP
jgi:hypothetical protein